MSMQQLENVAQDVHLTQKETKLLEALMSHPNQVLSRRFLLRNVWDYSEGTRTRTVDVHIRRLRSKLGACPDLRIYTVFGEGYVLENGSTGRSGAESSWGGLPLSKHDSHEAIDPRG